MRATLSKSGYGRILSLSILLWCSSVWAVQVSWQAPTKHTDDTPANDLAGFNLYYRQAGQPTYLRIDVGLQTNYPPTGSGWPSPGLTVGQTYDFYVAAYDTSRREGLPSEQVSHTITNPPAAAAPVANNDTVSTPEDTSVTTGNVLANDTDANGDALSIVSFTSPARGSVVRSGTTAFTYTPQANFSGTDSFTYTIRDPGGLTAIGTVTVTVTSVNDPPVANPDTATTTAGTAVSISVLANDSDADNDALTVSATTTPSHGTVSRTGNTVTYTPSSGFTGPDSFNYTVSDGRGGTATGTVTVTVTAAGGNTGPTAGLVAAYNFDAGSGTTLTDVSGKANHGTISGATWTTQGRFNKALTFDGVNDAVTVPDASALDLGSRGTIEAWAKLTALGRWHSVIAKGTANNNAVHNYALEITNTNRARCILGNGTASQLLDSSTTLGTGQFYHLACTWDGTTVKLYVNGTLNRSVAQALTPAGNTASLLFGKFGGNVDWLAGTIDEVRIYNRGLSAEEILNDRNTPSVPTPIADFSATPTTGPASLTVAFTDASIGSVTAWAWNFGDGHTGTTQNPSHTYTAAGTYTVSLTVTGAGGSDSESKINYITVSVPAPTNGLAAAYRFDEGGGTVVGDASSNGNSGTIAGATWTPQGQFGTALSFDGVNDAVTVPDAATLDLGSRGTVMAWVKLTALGRWHSVIAKGNANNNAVHNYALEITNTNVVRCILGNGTASIALDSSSTLSTGQWYHLACTWDGTTVTLYMNGTLNRSRAQTLTPAGNTASLLFGKFGGNVDWLAGTIDEVRLYDHALTANEVPATLSTTIGPLPAATQPLAVMASARSTAGNQNASARINVPVKNLLRPPLAGSQTTPAADTATGASAVTPPDSTVGFFEFGEVQVSSTWRTVTFHQPFSDPIVVAKAPSNVHHASSLVRIRDVTPTGFALRLQGEDALDGAHGPETVGYLVVERGWHTLTGDLHIEAGSKEISQTNGFVTVPFRQAFAVAPVVLTAVVSPNEKAAVTTQVRHITTRNFQVRMQEQPESTQSPAQETITYIAWPPSSGTLAGDLIFEVQKTPYTMTHQRKTLRFMENFTAIPVFLADLQTTHGKAHESLLWDNKDFFGVDVRVAEEPSTARAIEQTTEVIGYMAFAFHDTTTDSDGDGLTNADEIPQE